VLVRILGSGTIPCDFSRPDLCGYRDMSDFGVPWTRLLKGTFNFTENVSLNFYGGRYRYLCLAVELNNQTLYSDVDHTVKVHCALKF
jgi:hypothetical protein